MPHANPSVYEIFTRAAELSACDRDAWLRTACGDDHLLRNRVERLLRARDEAKSFLDTPAISFVSTVNPAWLPAPSLEIGPYRLVTQIGEGGMGVVFLAEQQEPVQRRVAIKIIKPGGDSRQVVARFDSEKELLARMAHPNIATVLDAGLTSVGQPFFVMEYVEGQPITQFCEMHGLSLHERLALFLPVCQAIQHAHQKGIIHRDIKPSNVLITRYDDLTVPKVIDFGIAKAIGQAASENDRFTGPDQVIGTLEYMSPEQARVNGDDPDTRSDVYSLGVLLYELLTGTTPVEKRLRTALPGEVRQIIRDFDPPRPSVRLAELGRALPSGKVLSAGEQHRLIRSVRGDLDWIVMKALEKERSQRYSTADALAEDVRRFLNHESVLARPPAMTYQLWKWMRRNRRPVFLALFFLLMTGSLGMILNFAGQVNSERIRAAGLRAENLRVAALEQMRRPDRFAGWSQQCRRLLTQARQIQHTQADDNLTVGVLEKFDMRLLKQWNGFNAGSVAISRSGSALATGSVHDSDQESGVRLWNLDDHEPPVVAPHAIGPVRFTSSGAVCCRIENNAEGRSVVLMELETHRVASRCRIPAEFTTNPAETTLSDQGCLLACVFPHECYHLTDHCSVVVWNTTLEKIIYRQELPCTAISLTESEQLLATGDGQGRVRVHDLTAGRQIAFFRAGRLRVLRVAFSSTRWVDTTNAEMEERTTRWRVAVGMAGGGISIHSSEDPLAKTYIAGGNYDVYALAFSPDGTLLASAGRNHVRMWDAASGDSLLRLDSQKISDHGRNYQLDLAFSNDGRRLAVASMAAHGSLGGVDIWQLESQGPILSLRGLSDPIDRVVFSKSGRLVAALSQAWRAGVWDATSGELMLLWDVPPGRYSDNADLAFSADERTLAFSTLQDAALVDIQTRTVVQTWSLPPGMVDRLSFVDSQHLYLIRSETKERLPADKLFEGSGRVTRIRNLLGSDPLTPLTTITVHDHQLIDAIIAGDGHIVVMDGEAGQRDSKTRSISAVDILTGDLLWEHESHSLWGGVILAVDPSGEQVACLLTHTSTATVFNSRTGQQLYSLPWSPQFGFLPDAVRWYSVDFDPCGMVAREGREGRILFRLGMEEPVSRAVLRLTNNDELISWANPQGEVYVCSIGKLQEYLRSLTPPHVERQDF